MRDVRARCVESACRAAVVDETDAQQFALSAAASVHLLDGGRVVVLLRLEANAAARAFRITVRSRSPDAANAFKNVLQALITSYIIL